MSKQKSGMVDISSKNVSRRRAVACGSVVFDAKTFMIFLKQGSPKGDILETAKIAGIMAAKSTPQIIPLCHPLILEKVSVKFAVEKATKSVVVEAEVICSGKTGVEMEALTAVAAACLSVYDMMKWASHAIKISEIKLLHKSGGKSGIYKGEK